MQSVYDDAGGDWTWDDSVKLSELSEARMRFLYIISDSCVLAFLAFRFESASSVPVAYVFEIQTAVSHMGYGSLLMASLARICAELTGVRKLMLTVLLNNAGARNFYRKQGWVLDDSSPENAPYAILCRFID